MKIHYQAAKLPSPEDVTACGKTRRSLRMGEEVTCADRDLVNCKECLRCPKRPRRSSVGAAARKLSATDTMKATPRRG